MEAIKIKNIDIISAPNEVINVYINGIKKYSTLTQRTSNRSEISIKEFVDDMCKIFNIDYYQLIGGRNTRNLAEIKHALYYYLKYHFIYTYNYIGNFFARDHTTVMYGCHKYTDYLKIKDEKTLKIDNIIKTYLEEQSIKIIK